MKVRNFIKSDFTSVKSIYQPGIDTGSATFQKKAKGRYTTIATHLQHFLSYIGKDTMLRELERTDCENYFYHRHKATNGNVKQVTVQNGQSTINALKEVKHLCKEFGFTGGMLKGSLAEGRKTKGTSL